MTLCLCQDVSEMSSPYLDLMARIPVVASKTEIGEERLREAQDRTGLSDEAVARQIHIATKTWYRWKKAGAVPTAQLPAVARALHLEFHDEPTVFERPREAEDALALIDARLESLEALVRESVDLTRESLLLLLESRRADPVAPKRRRRANG